LTELIKRAYSKDNSAELYLIEQFERTPVKTAATEMSLSLLSNYYMSLDENIYE
jgi:hypothetical protein